VLVRDIIAKNAEAPRTNSRATIRISAPVLAVTRWRELQLLVSVRDVFFGRRETIVAGALVKWSSAERAIASPC
jgi:hypothetical protein